MELDSFSDLLFLLLQWFGLLPYPELETSVLSVCLTTINTLFSIPYGIGAAASTSIANELGAGNPQEARVAAHGGVMMGAANGLVISSILFATRKVFGYCFISDKQVVNYVTTMAPLVCVNLIMDSIFRCCQRVWVATYRFLCESSCILRCRDSNRGCIRLLGADERKGTLAGNYMWTCGGLTQCVLLLIITSRTNWEEEARKARNNVIEDSSRNSTGAYADEQRPLIN